jgi:hypothetical protein
MCTHVNGLDPGVAPSIKIRRLGSRKYNSCIMRKYLAIVGLIVFWLAVPVILGLAVYINCQDIRYAQDVAQKTVALHKSAAPANADEKYSPENVPAPERKAPSWCGWYDFFRWPNGTTAWAIILTLIVIAEQTRQTRKAAEAAARGIEIQERGQRAWLIIRSAMKDYEPSTADKQLRFYWSIKNCGRLPAQILTTQCKYELIDGGLLYPPEKSRPDDPLPIDMGGYLIAPKETQKYYTMLWTNDTVVIPPLSGENINKIREGSLHLRVYGYVKYIDGLGAERESRFIENYIWPELGLPRHSVGFRRMIGAPQDYIKCI